MSEHISPPFWNIIKNFFSKKFLNLPLDCTLNVLSYSETFDFFETLSNGRGALQNLYISTQALLSKKFQKCPKVIHMYYGWPLKNTRYTIIHTVYNLPETMRWKHGFWALKWLSLLLKLSHQPLCQKSHIDLLKRMKQPCLWNLSYS